MAPVNLVRREAWSAEDRHPSLLFDAIPYDAYKAGRNTSGSTVANAVAGSGRVMNLRGPPTVVWFTASHQ
jgi:hypothetical protein